MSNDQTNHRGFLPPPTTTAADLHLQPPPPSAGENPHPFTLLSQTTPPTTPKTTPESQLAAAIGRAIHAIPATSFRDAIAAATTTTAAVNPLRRTLSDASSSDYYPPSSPITTTTTPPKAPERSGPSPLRRTVSAPISLFHRQETDKTLTPALQKVPVARSVFPATNPRAMVVLPESSNRKGSPGFKRLKKIEERVRDIEQRCWEVMQECESVVSDEDNSSQSQGMMMMQEEEGVKEECVAFETLGDGGLRFRLSCSCGKRFEILLKDNGCFYKLT